MDTFDESVGDEPRRFKDEPERIGLVREEGARKDYES
jgi:hypothetical protein